MSKCHHEWRLIEQKNKDRRWTCIRCGEVRDHTRRIELSEEEYGKLSSYSVLAWADTLGQQVNEGLGYEPQICGFLRAVAISMQKTDTYSAPEICAKCKDKGWYFELNKTGGRTAKWCFCVKGERREEEKRKTAGIYAGGIR